jgi:hypothetical protein
MRCYILALFALLCCGLAECAADRQLSQQGYTQRQRSEMDALVARVMTKPPKHKAMTPDEQAAAMVYLWGQQ